MSGLWWPKAGKLSSQLNLLRSFFQSPDPSPLGMHSNPLNAFSSNSSLIQNEFKNLNEHAYVYEH